MLDRPKTIPLARLSDCQDERSPAHDVRMALHSLQSTISALEAMFESAKYHDYLIDESDWLVSNMVRLRCLRDQVERDEREI